MGADAQGIQVTSHSRQIIRLPILGTPRLPQFQHSLGSVFCWLPLIFLHPVFALHDRDPQSRANPVYIRGEHPRAADTFRDRRWCERPSSGLGDQRGPGFATRLGGAPGRPGRAGGAQAAPSGSRTVLGKEFGFWRRIWP